MDLAALGEQIVSFTAIFLGIFIEAVPFLLLGTVASGLVEVFVQREDVMRLLPGSRLGAAVLGSLLGLAFPVGEGGVVPLARRLMTKGVPVSSGIAFLLAAPIVNPVVLASTYAAYGWGPMLLARLGLALAVAVTIGLIFSLNRNPTNMLKPDAAPAVVGGVTDAVPTTREEAPLGDRLKRSLRIAGDEFFELGRYLVIGALLGALIQTLVSQNALLALGTGPVVSVLIVQVLAFVLSVSSATDAFVSLHLASTFATGSLLSFLVFGAMVDIKSTLMFLGVFKLRYVVYLVVLPFLLTLLAGVLINLSGAW